MVATETENPLHASTLPSGRDPTVDGDVLAKGVPPAAAVLGLPSAAASSSGAPYYLHSTTRAEQWTLPSQPGGDSAHAARAAPMRRASDGAMYTRTQFVAYYGDAVKWSASMPDLLSPEGSPDEDRM